MRALVIPADSTRPIHEVEVECRGQDSGLAGLQALVGGYVEALPFPGGRTDVVVYINEQGKFTPSCEPNARATAFMAGYLFADDYIAGDLVLIGLDLRDGETVDLPADVRVIDVQRG
jgi:hypothetical protein